MTEMLRVSHLTKRFGATAVLRDVDFAVETGRLVAILGASGCGKTTLLRLIAGFAAPDAGDIHLNGACVAGAGIFRQPEARGIGYVAQDGALFPHLCVADNITFGLPRAQRRGRQRVAELLDLVGLPASYADRAPQQLSGGEQQRIALARALAPNPRLVLLDEPFSALDAGLREDTRRAVADALRAANATAILVTHDQAEALSLGALVGVLQNGILKQMSPPETLYRRPADVALANFVGEAVFATGIAAGGLVECALGTLRLGPADPNGPVEIMVRPEQIKLREDATTGGVPARIEQVIFHGHDASVRLRLTSKANMPNVTARVFSHAVPPTGSDVWLTVDGAVVGYPAAPHAPPLNEV